ncbi:hypothetical protein C1H46_039912 [Malus baccata]|uniref:DUF4408 domain-containing protein n=1 Tax=Malus baccata TaxID=106549 RepID=A0A540KKJ5_MALBA|nr:hypothetical protein C1H46_039912 [Malus baccata]
MMADAFKRGRLETAIWAAKVLLLCVGTVSTVVFFKAAIIPYLLNLCLSIVPHIRTSFKNCCSLSPLYIYIILNFIILTIAASSAFQRQNHNHKHHLSSSSVASGDTTKNNAKATDRIDPSHDFIYSPDNNTDNKYNSSQSQMLSALFAATDPQVPEYCELLKTDDFPVCAFISQDCRPTNPSEESHNVKTSHEVWEKTFEMIGLPSDAVDRLIEGEEVASRYGAHGE